MNTTPSIGGERLSRRGVITAALAAGLTVPLGLSGRASAAAVAAGPRRFVLPAPTGPFPIGTVPLHLVDRSRPDPVAGPGHHRELMVSVWYPARDVARYPRARWLSDALMRELLTYHGFPADALLPALTAGHVGAPVRRAGGRMPVVVFSHGAHDHRGHNTIVVQELVSHGYVVVTVDHTHDAFSEFPDGRLTVPIIGGEHSLGAADFAADIPFVLDRIAALAAGRNPDADGRPLPAGLPGLLDPGRVGMFGFSKGGTATALAMGLDQRIRAGLSLDAQMEPLIETDLARPFMMMSADYTRAEPSVAQFWSHLTGWRLNVRAADGRHLAYTDYQIMLPHLAVAVGMTEEDLEGWAGTLDATRAARIQQAYPLAFFDLHLRHRRQRLLEGPSPAFPGVCYIP
ncbi:acetylhydrolase [Plantactinospora sp. B5E13]|uniref:alpha/beta hydrolase family protein n=1 Tax=Plantactinospora sp. B5E13 TaxID=3153758 RepID=UPI00325E29C5